MSNVNIRLQSTEKKFMFQNQIKKFMFQNQIKKLMFQNQILSKGLVLLIKVTQQWKKQFQFTMVPFKPMSDL